MTLFVRLSLCALSVNCKSVKKLRVNCKSLLRGHTSKVITLVMRYQMISFLRVQICNWLADTGKIIYPKGQIYPRLFFSI